MQSKLDDPELQYDTTPLHSADVMGRTKSFQNLVAGGMQLDQAARPSGGAGGIEKERRPDVEEDPTGRPKLLFNEQTKSSLIEQLDATKVKGLSGFNMAEFTWTRERIRAETGAAAVGLHKVDWIPSEKGYGFNAFCPAHDDDKPSLFVAESKNKTGVSYHWVRPNKSTCSDIAIRALV